MHHSIGNMTTIDATEIQHSKHIQI